MKYKLTETTRDVCGRTLHRIEAVADFADVKRGEQGGWIESERNLSQDGNAWVCGNAKVYGNAEVGGDAWIYDNAKVCGGAEVYDDAWIFDDAEVYGNAEVGGNTRIYDNAKVFGGAKVRGNTSIYDNAEVGGDAEVYNNAVVRGDARVMANRDYIVFKNWWSSGRYFTWTRSNNMWRVGCFYGTGPELIAKAYADSELSGREYERIVKYVESILADEKGGEG